MRSLNALTWRSLTALAITLGVAMVLAASVACANVLACRPRNTVCATFTASDGGDKATPPTPPPSTCPTLAIGLSEVERCLS